MRRPSLPTAILLGLTAAIFIPGAAHAATDTVAVNFAQSTGTVKGEAAGALYGMSDAGVPTAAVLAGASPRSMTTKPPGGQQHPHGEPLEEAPEFWATGGRQILVNIQDAYADWPYNGGARPTDFSTYTAMITTAVKAIKAGDPTHFSQYVFVPFNEPDGGNWYADYANLKTQFLADWSSAYQAIKAVDSTAKVGGPGLAAYSHTRLADLLAYAKANNQLPDVVTWHELSRSSLAGYRANYADYRAIETSLGVPAIPINITEWGDRRDLSVPGQLVQWLAMFEGTKVAGNTAYWTYAGNLNDNSAGPNGGNGAWWLTKWYADLTGVTVPLTPPQSNVADTVQGIATLDTGRQQATILVGGGSNDIKLNLSGLSTTVFGSSVDIRVSRAAWSGYDGETTQPPVVQASRSAVTGGSVSLTIPNTDRMSAYQVIVTPAAGTAPIADAPWSSSIEAENTTLTDVTAYPQDTDANTWLYATSGKADVGSTNKVTSALTWSVTVPATGTYRLTSYGGANKAPGQHALFVDGQFSQLIQYTADLGWTYRGKAEVTLPLSAGTHTLSVRMSKDGSTLLPGSDIALDKFELTDVTAAEKSTYPARFARTAGSASQFFLAAHDNGYYDLAVRYRSPNGATPVTATLNGRALPALGSTAAGTWTATTRVHLAQGISELRVTPTGGAQLDTVTLTRAALGDTATKWIEVESGTLTGATKIATLAAGTNASGGKGVTWLGGGSANALTLARPAGTTTAGAYDIGVHYANADQNTASHYNTDVISRSMTISEAGGASVTGVFRHNYSWTSFWWLTLPMNLTTGSGSLTLGNTSGYAPDIDGIAVSPLVLSTTVAAS